MRSIKIFITILSLTVVAISASAFISGRNTKPDNNGKGFAVIELFTSEGCSSCPPADALIARVEKESSDKPIYILAYHVDYWNRLGWKDAFSSPEYSARQNQYARWLKSSQIYTPQAIVNGRTEFVGSEETSLRNAIKSGLETPAKTQLTLGSIKVGNDKAIVQYHTEGTTGNNVIVIALVQKNATTKVQRGENGGRTLAHVQIVSQFKTTSLNNGGSGTESFTLPHGFDPQKWELIGFVQDTSNGEITGASKAEFSSNMSAEASR
jgi:hypothetical protein